MSVSIAHEPGSAVAVLRLEGDERRANVLHPDDYVAVARVCAGIADDPSIRTVVVAGTDQAFSAGTDMQIFRDAGPGFSGSDYERGVVAAVEALRSLPQVTIARISGPCTGGGMVLAAATDLRVCSEGAVFGAPIARTVGNTLAPQAVRLLASIVGLSAVQWMLLSGSTIDAAEAHRIGLVHSAVAADDLDGIVAAQANACAALAPLTVRSLKDMLASTTEPLDQEQTDRMLDAMYSTADFHEGVTAFLEKRPPHWKGR